jgi:hypothetical protein
MLIYLRMDFDTYTADEELEMAYVKKFILNHLPTINGKKCCIEALKVVTNAGYPVPAIIVNLTFVHTKRDIKTCEKLLRNCSGWNEYMDGLRVIGGIRYHYRFDNVQDFENHYRSTFNIPEK